MMASQQGMWAYALCCLLAVATCVPPCVCQTATVKVAADFDAIQAAINNLHDDNPSTARVIQIAAGTVDFGTRSLLLNKLGVTLQGAGPGSTIFQSALTTGTVARDAFQRLRVFHCSRSAAQ